MNMYYLLIIILLSVLIFIATKCSIISRSFNNNKMNNFTSKTYYQMWFELADQIVDRKSRISVSRYGDGEYLIMTGKPFQTQDHFGYKGGESRFKEELYKSLKCPGDSNCYYGVWLEHLNEFIKWSNRQPKYFSAANIFVNKNYPKTKLLLESLVHDENKEIILLCNFLANHTSFAKEVYYFPNEIISYYETNYHHIIVNSTRLAKKYNNHLFMLSIGPLAPILIWHMVKANPNNRYVDFGSTADELIKGHSNREYVNPNTSYAQLIEKSFVILKNNSIFFF